MSDNDRRYFLKKTLLSLVTATGASGFISCHSQEKKIQRSRSIISSHRVVTVRKKGELVEKSNLDDEVLSTMLDVGMKTLTGLSGDPGWQQIFQPSDRVGLKVNTLAGKGISTHPELANALAHRISHSSGIKPEHIIVWDRESAELIRAGFSISDNSGRISCFGTDHYRAGYRKDLSISGNVCGQLSRILTDLTDVTVNVPVLKDHNLAGLSGGLKNMYGVIHNPNKYHENNCNPFVAELNVLPEIKNRLGLIVADALKVQYEGGPGYHARYTVPQNTIVLGTDPVAVDAILLQLIDQIRSEHSQPPLEQTDHPPVHIQTASQKPYNLGLSDLEKIEHITVEV